LLKGKEGEKVKIGRMKDGGMEGWRMPTGGGRYYN